MSDAFIPLNQSTPVHNQKRWQGQCQNPQIFQQSGQRGSWKQISKRGGFNTRNNNSQPNNSLKNSSYSSQGKDQGIEAYLHPSMLQDPWAYLRRRNAENQSY